MGKGGKRGWESPRMHMYYCRESKGPFTYVVLKGLERHDHLLNRAESITGQSINCTTF